MVALFNFFLFYFMNFLCVFVLVIFRFVSTIEGILLRVLLLILVMNMSSSSKKNHKLSLAARSVSLFCLLSVPHILFLSGRKLLACIFFYEMMDSRCMFSEFA